jgi:hypothetical protein
MLIGAIQLGTKDFLHNICFCFDDILFVFEISISIVVFIYDMKTEIDFYLRFDMLTVSHHFCSLLFV